MFSKTFQHVARSLYFDDVSGKLKRGAGSKGPGSPRRLAKVRQQLDVTWELEDLDHERDLEMLPTEFERFKSVEADRQSVSERNKRCLPIFSASRTGTALPICLEIFVAWPKNS